VKAHLRRLANTIKPSVCGGDAVIIIIIIVIITSIFKVA